ncbi:hypothetical protein ACFLXO_07315 [Chloroflexota bacterium]
MNERELGSSLKGKIAATLIGMGCAQGSNGGINFASPFVDDDGVDLIFFRKGGSGKAILAQVKSRTMKSKLLSQGTFRVQVRRANFKPGEGYYFIFVALDESGKGLHDALWFIPSVDFERKLAGQTNEKVLVFQSMFNSRDMWKQYRMSLDELPRRIAQIL